MMKKKLGIIIGIFILTAGAAYFASAAGIVFFGDNSRLETEVFTQVGTSTWIVPAGVNSVELLVVAGGGGGGSGTSGSGGGGGGGAGGLKYISSFSVTPGQSINIVVGDGGAPGEAKLSKVGNDGTSSSFGTVTTTGGGGGANAWGANAHPGGSGGGGGYNGYSTVRIGGSGVVGEGNAGGSTSMLSWAGGAGGGGAGGIGGDNKINHAGGDRGPGLTYSITGPSITYARGGGGGANSPVISIANTGNGGDAAYAAGTAYAGASGIVVIRYPKSVKTQTPSLQKGLIGHWALDSDGFDSTTNRVTDKTPYANHGTNYGATLTTDRMGQNNGAMSFDGASSYVSTNNPIDISSSKSRTISVWFYPEVKQTQNLLGYGIQVNGRLLDVYLGSTGQIGGHFYGAAFDTLGAGSPIYVLNQWQHFVITYDGSVAYIYYNGEYYKQKIVALDTANSQLFIGKGVYAALAKFKGKISDVRIYNRALSGEEIKSLYNSYKPKIVSDSLQKGLILDMPLTSIWTKSEVSGSQIMIDKTPYSHNGQNYGGIVSTEGTLLSNTGDRISTSFAVPNQKGTISIWYKPTYGAKDVNRNSVLYNTGASWVPNSFEFALRSCCGNPYDNVFYMSDSGNSNLPFEWDTPIWQAGEWINLTVIYTANGSIKPYINGVAAVVSGGTNSGVFVFPNMFNIGAKNSSSVSAKGTVSGLKIYDRVLSVSEIKSLFDKGR